MKDIKLSVSGNLRSQNDDIEKHIYRELFAKLWNDKSIWESIRDKELTSAPCIVGKQYFNEDIKIMIVGRAVNGWEVEFDDCSYLDATVNSVLKQENRLDDFAKEYILYDDVEGDEVVQKKYYYAKSPFLRMMRQTVGRFTNSEENWQQRIVWSNLFKIAPRKGGNPSWKMIRDDLDLYIKLIQHEINAYQPDLVLFVTGMSFFDPYPNNEKYPSFGDLVNEEKFQNEEMKYVYFKGAFKDNPLVKVIVSSRPEGRPIQNIIDEIFETYQEML